MNEAPSRTGYAAGHDCNVDADAMSALRSPTNINGPKPATAAHDQRETDAVRFIITSIVITAIIFGFINLIVYVFEPAQTAGAVVTAPLSPMNAPPMDPWLSTVYDRNGTRHTLLSIRSLWEK
jgi:hypothetical protein